MIRTFLLTSRPPQSQPEFDDVIERASRLYQARLVRAVIRGTDELLATPGTSDATEPKAASERNDQLNAETESRVSENIQSVVLVGEFVSAVCDKGHEADVIAVWHECLRGADGSESQEEVGKLVREAPRPVWIGREPTRFPEHIVVAYDGSTHSGRGLHMAANLAETLGARLTVLHVDESHDNVAQELILSRAAGYCEPYRIAMERVGVRGSATTGIRDYAEASHADLLVLGAAGVGYLRGLLFGSVAGQLVTNSPCSVLVAK